MIAQTPASLAELRALGVARIRVEGGIVAEVSFFPAQGVAPATTQELPDPSQCACGHHVAHHTGGVCQHGCIAADCEPPGKKP